jgi:hypothetical protein
MKTEEKKEIIRKNNEGRPGNIKWIEYERKKTIKLSIASLETQFASVRSIQNMQHTWPPIPKLLPILHELRCRKEAWIMEQAPGVQNGKEEAGNQKRWEDYCWGGRKKGKKSGKRCQKKRIPASQRQASRGLTELAFSAS